jgi:hypothetical protein
MPKDAEHLQACAGDLIFLPRGWWHTTHAVGNCVQLNFTMDGPMLLEVVAEVLAAELRKDPRCRQYAHGIASRTSREVHAQLSVLLPELGAHLEWCHHTRYRGLFAMIDDDATPRPLSGPAALVPVVTDRARAAGPVRC